MLPLNPDEILVLRGGGSLAVNGVLLKSIMYDFPQFSFDHNYVLFFSAIRRNRRSVLFGWAVMAFFLLSLAIN